jgi:hypothetical protein
VRGKRSQREREEEEEAADGFSGGTMQRWPLTPEASSVLVLQGVRKQQLNLDRLDHRRLLTTMDKKWQKPTCRFMDTVDPAGAVGAVEGGRGLFWGL